MLDYKQIEKIHPMILFLVFTIALSSILPLFFLAPPSSESQTFNESSATGSITYQLSGNHLFFTLSLTTLNKAIFLFSTNIIQIDITLNKDNLVTFPYEVSNQSLDSLPLIFMETINLTQSDIFGTSFTIESKISFNYYSHVTLQSIIGRIDYPLYDKWFIITAVGCIGLFGLTSIVLKQKENLNYIEIIKNYFQKNKYSYSVYEEALTKINDNFYFIFYLAPLILIFALMYQIYFIFSQFEGTTLLLFDSKLTLSFVIAAHSYLILTSPAILNTIVDEFKGNRLVRKNRIKDNLIFVPFLIVFYSFVFVLFRFIPNEILFAVCVIFSFLINTTFYYLSLVHHSWKLKYQMKRKNILLYSIYYRLGYTALVLFIILFFIYSTTPYPVYLLLF